MLRGKQKGEGEKEGRGGGERRGEGKEWEEKGARESEPRDW